MEVYLIPVGDDRYELYCEVVEDDAVTEDQPNHPRGMFRRLVHRVRVALKNVDKERRGGPADPPHSLGERRKWTRRLRDRVLCWVAEKVAEQRLLWHLRRQEEATAIFPADLSDSAATSTIRQMLRRDAERHRFWLVIDVTGFVLSGLFFLVPGPNLVAYYFAFRLVGHYLSMRGARQGLDTVTWRMQPSPDLLELRRAIALTPPEREERVSDIASRLRLEHLASFFERTAIPIP